VQWVDKGRSFNTYRMLRFTERTIAISTAEFACGSNTYTFRVFVMREGWQLADGHQTQNVTPHSEPFDITTVHACPAPATTTTTVPLSCAAGGVCAVGDTGPGGGIVFYVASSNFTSTGSDCGTTCRYLEVAPDASEDTRTWATGANQSAAVTGADATGIGSGYQNTVDVNAQAGNVAATSAAVYAFDYTNNSKTDWHLPSQDELNELCKYARNTGQAAGAATVCAGGSLRAGFSGVAYWSSSEYSATLAWYQDFDNGTQANANKVNTARVRPVRAF